MAARGVYGTVLIGRNQLHIFDNDNFSIIPKSIFSDNDNLPISCKNADISAVDNVFDNIAHPYQQAVLRGALRQQTAFTLVLLAMERSVAMTYMYHRIAF